MELLIRLIDLGHITPDDALAVLEAQRASRLPLGKIGLEAGLIEVHQIFRILSRCADTNERFGEAAIALGILSEAQVAVLLLRQEQATPPVEELLVEMQRCDAALIERLSRRQAS